jgi:hypothetical protein
MHQRAEALRDGRDLSDRLKHAGLVIGQMQRDQRAGARHLDSKTLQPRGNPG